MKIRAVGAELFHEDRRTDGQTGMAKLIVAFPNFANAHKMIVTAEGLSPKKKWNFGSYNIVVIGKGRECYRK
jgi:hypothetical protein